MTILLYAATIALIVLLMGLFTARTHKRLMNNMKGQPIAHMTVSTTLKLEEQEEVKKYAAIFGLDNETITSAIELLEMGRKVEASLGREKMEEIVNLSLGHSHPVMSGDKNANVISRIVNALIKTTELLCPGATRIQILTMQIGGGRNGKEEASAI